MKKKMTEISTIQEGFKMIIDRYNSEEKIRKKLANYDKPIELTFLDNNHKAMIIVNKDQGIEIKDNVGDDNALVKIHFESEQVMIDLFNGEIGAVGAYSSGKIKVIAGKIRNLIKLRKLLF